MIMTMYNPMRTLYASVLAFALPLAASAAERPTDFKGVVALFLGLIDTVIYLVFAATILVLVWGVLRAWVLGGGDAHKVDAGKKLVLIGIITLVIMTSIWGILQVLRNSLM
jgi:hypothetical protein